jgi:hypothetical protein
MASNKKKTVIGAVHEKKQRKGQTCLKDFIEILPKYREQAFKTIGEIIASVSALERIMDSFIAEHFCKEKDSKKELCNLILSTNRITYESKREVLHHILNKHFPSFIKSHPTVLKDMQDIGELRNVMAHGLLDIQNFVNNTRNKKVVLKRYKGETEYMIFNHNEVRQIIDKINNCANALRYWNFLTEVH